jgi:hypothetical protein
MVMLFPLLLPVEVSSASKERFVYYFLGCDEVEVYSDIEVSIDGFAKFASENNIRLVRGEESRKCGYFFVVGERFEFVESALTDVDLLLMSKEFFQIE